MTCPESDMVGQIQVSSETGTFTLPAAERHRILFEWNQTARAYPRDKCIHQLFEEQVNRTPEAIAVVFEGISLTYGELNRRANRLAHLLQQFGIRREIRVAVHLDRSLEYAVSVLGILKAGGVYVPLARDYPLDRQRFMLEDSGAAVVLTMNPLSKALQQPNLTVLDLSRAAASLEVCATDNPESPGSADDLAYVMYTSGSTGRPKGVTIPHRGVVRLVRAQRYAEFDADQRFMFLASPSFDASTFELWGPLLNGATCVIFPQDLANFEVLEQVVREQDVTCLWLTAGLFNQIIDQRPSVLETVRHVLTGGDALSGVHVQRALGLLPVLRITNGYGPTEGTTFTCTYEVNRGTPFPTGSVPIGRPLANTQCYILDAHGNPTPMGVPGELYIGGDGLARGYLNLPELTAEKFVPNPFSPEPKSRLYKTGDFARHFSDGTIEFLGRRDLQVKIRGFRIELGEIESVLETHPDVRACAVVARAVHENEKRLVAFVVPRERAALSAHALRAWLGRKLPDYMQPSRFVVMEALPLTLNGKVNRNALENLQGSDVGIGTDHIPPRTRTERTLVEIWQEVLGRPQVGIHDSFFDLGGQSLLAVRTVGRIHRETGVLLPLSLFFSQPTVLQLAQFLDRETQNRAVAEHATSVETPTGAPLFLLGWYLHLESLDLVGWPHYVLPFPDFAVSREQCRVEYLADTCLQTLRAIRPKGPYRLAGYSLAGLVAFEMACRLEADGEVVQMVGVVDTVASTRLLRAAPRAIGALAKLFRLNFRAQLLLARAWFYVLDLADQGLRQSARQAMRAIGSDMKRAWRVWHLKRSFSADTAGTSRPSCDAGSTDLASRQMPFGKFWAHRWAHSLYRPRPYTGTVTLFTSEELATKYPAPGRGWRRWAPCVREYIIPGTHGSCVTSHKRELAEKFRKCLAELSGEEHR
jgi:amino acid adenylation domain-containing protein